MLLKHPPHLVADAVRFNKRVRQTMLLLLLSLTQYASPSSLLV
jgi:hypothetical protein